MNASMNVTACVAGCHCTNIVYDWARGLGGVPDEPHAVHVSLLTEGNGVGVKSEPPVEARVPRQDLTALAKAQVACSLTFKISLTDCLEVTWETLLAGSKLFIEVPQEILPDGSKESFITLLEYAEEILKCSHVLVCFKKDRTDRASLIRTFMFLGFALIPPGSPLVSTSGDVLYMAYSIDNEDSDED